MSEAFVRCSPYTKTGQVCKKSIKREPALFDDPQQAHDRWIARFRIPVRYSPPPGRGVALTGESGYFWFFDAANVEVVVKVLDACAPPFNRFWVFTTGLTNVGVKLTVEDIQTGAVREYVNPRNRPFQPTFDTNAFAICP
jgi:hypothetical protein